MGLFSDRRMRAVLLVLSLLGVGCESVLPHDCATMGAVAAAAPAHAGHSHGAPAQDAHAQGAHEQHAAATHDHASSDAAPRASSDAPAETPVGHECDCIGDCCCVPVATLAQARTESAEWPATDASVARAAATDERLPVAPRYLRPFANGPPAAPTA